MINKLTPIEYYNKNKGLIQRVINTLHEHGIPEEDLMQEAYIAIHKYLPNFNPEKGVKLDTYMFYVLRGQLLSYIENNKYSIRIPRGVYYQARKDFNGESEKVSKRYNTFHKQRFSAIRNMIEIDALPSFDCNLLMGINNEDTENIDNYFIERFIDKNSWDVKPRTIEIVKQRFGIGKDKKEHTFREIADKYGISTARAQELVSIALKKIRKNIERRYKFKNMGDLING